MSIYKTKVYHIDREQYSNLIPAGWHYHIHELLDSGISIRSDRGAYETSELAQAAMSRELRGREVLIRLDELSLEEKEKLLGL